MANNENGSKRDYDELRSFEEGVYLPRIDLGPHVPHYYGDFVRRLFIGAAALMLVYIPIFALEVPILLPVQVLGAVALITLGALTSPKKKSTLLADAVAAGCGILIFEIVSFAAYAAENYVSFVAHEALSMVFILALYFALKTVRAMDMGQIGKRERSSEFRKSWREMSWHTRDPRNN